MEIKIKNNNIAKIISDTYLITNPQTALDTIMAVRYETGCNRIIFDKSHLVEEFFDLKTKLAGDVLQKFINYKFKVAIVGDFSVYNSNSLKDFIYETNKGKDIFFVSEEAHAIEKLSLE